MRLFLTLYIASVFSLNAQSILFQDTFDRAANRNIDASLSGITDNTGSSLPADAVYSQPWLDPNNGPPNFGAQDAAGTNGGGAQILSNQLQLAVGVGTSNAFINHNFTNAAILSAGGFSVSLDIAGLNQGTVEQGGAFAVGMSQARAASTKDAWDVNPSMTGTFNTAAAIGNAVPGTVVSDFWIGLRANGTLAWGGSTGTVKGVTGLAKTGTITVKFSFPDFNQGTTVHYEVFYSPLAGTATSRGTGTFTWTANNQNYIGLDARDGSGVLFDNLKIATSSPSTVAGLSVSPSLVAADNSSQAVVLSWSASAVPAGASYEITADRAVTFPDGGATGPAVNGSGTVNAIVNGTLGDTTFTFSISDSTPAVVASATAKVTQVQPPSPRPNVVVILVDDLGWADLGCYGSEIPTPNIDALAAGGVRFRQFVNSTRCSPTRCSLLTGLYPQQAASDPATALPNLRNDNNVTFAEMLGADGYRTYMAGKWHLGGGALVAERRGFDHVWRFANGSAHSADQWEQSVYSLISQNNEIAFRDYTGSGQTFYQTDAIGDYAVDFINHNQTKSDGKPFALYMAFGAPHFPLGAPAAMVNAAVPTYTQGWDVIRRQRYDRQLAMGVIDNRYPFPPLGGTGPHQAEPIVAIPAWSTLSADRKADLARRMAIYTAMVRKIDENVGKVTSRLQQIGRLDNTLIVFMSDNGGNHEGGVFGNTTNAPVTGAALTNMGLAGQNDGIHYGGGWAHVSNTPLKLFKHFTHEGGIRAPLIAYWPAGFSQQGTWVEKPVHLIDVMSTIVEATGTIYPTSFNSHPVLPLEGQSLLPAIKQQPTADRPLFVEHESNRMIRKGKWKLVTEAFTAFDAEFTAHQKLLYDMDADPGETTNLAESNPVKVVELTDEWNAWSTRVGLPTSRLMVTPPENVTPASTSADLFLDTFDRPNATDTDASNAGMSGSRVPPLGNGTSWFEGFEGSGTNGSIQVDDNFLKLANGVGMSESGVNHNFVGQEILSAGGFSVSLRILDINTDATDMTNRFAGFGVGLNATQAAGGNDISNASPPPIRGSTGNPGTADCFVELDLNGNLKLWIRGALISTVATGKTKGTLTASFACNSFAANSTVNVSAYLDGTRIDLNPGNPGMGRNFTWDESNANFIALSARATNFVQMDNFAVRTLPLSHALATEYALAAGLRSANSATSSNPDGDRLDNFGEWAFGTNPNKSDDELAATSVVLSLPTSGVLKVAFRRLVDFASAGVTYHCKVSNDLTTWREATTTEESTMSLSGSPNYEAVTLALSPEEMAGQDKLFVRISAEP